jgi:hypothetical protein
VVTAQKHPENHPPDSGRFEMITRLAFGDAFRSFPLEKASIAPDRAEMITHSPFVGALPWWLSFASDLGPPSRRGRSPGLSARPELPGWTKAKALDARYPSTYPFSWPSLEPRRRKRTPLARATLALGPVRLLSEQLDSGSATWTRPHRREFRLTALPRAQTGAGSPIVPNHSLDDDRTAVGSQDRWG